MIAQTDDRELLEWLANADFRGGSFISCIAHAALVADNDNYALIRPFILKLREKYPTYEASLKVKQELREQMQTAAEIAGGTGDLVSGAIIPSARAHGE